MITKLYLIITLFTPNNYATSNIITIPVDTMAECTERGDNAITKLTKTRDDFTLMGQPSVTVLRKIEYECVEL